jgi:hypothetical protein
MEDLQKSINDGNYKFIGYKIGDRVQYKNGLGDEKNGTIKKVSEHGATTIGLIPDGTDGTPHYYPPENIIKVLEKVKPKYLKGEIFVREGDGLAKTYAQILSYYDAGDFPIESGNFKHSGLKVGDIVTFDSDAQEGKITGVEGALRIRSEGYGDAPVYRDVAEVKKKVEPTNQLSFEDLLNGKGEL